MHVSRGELDVEMVITKLEARFRRPTKISRPEWPVISATRPLFYLIRFFGLAPFEISEGRFISRSYDVIYSIFCTFVHTCAIYSVLNKPAIKRETVFLDIIENSKMAFNYCVAVLNIATAIWMRNEFIQVLNIVQHFDLTMRNLGHARREKATEIWVWCTCVWTASLWITVSCLGMAAFTEKWIDNVTYLLNYLAVSLSTIKFSGVVLLLGQRFRHLNNVAQLRKKPTTTRQKCEGIGFKVIQQLHNSLMNAGENLSSQYAWPLMLWLTNLCLHSVSNIYFLIDWLIDTPDWAKTPWLLLNCLIWWLISYVSQLILLHVACNFTSSEANSTGSIVMYLKSFAASKNYNLESSLYFINRKLTFSAAGCFHVNMRLLRSITSLVTTYLVLVFQFHH